MDRRETTDRDPGKSQLLDTHSLDHHLQLLSDQRSLSITTMTSTYPPAQPDAPSATLGSSLTSLSNQPSTLRYAPGIKLTPTQQYHACLVLDLFQAKGTWAKIEQGLTEDAVYEDLFATAKNRVEVGEFGVYRLRDPVVLTVRCPQLDNSLACRL